MIGLPIQVGFAVATILKSPGAGVRKAALLLGGAALSGLAHLAVLTYLGDDADWHAGDQFGLPAMLNISLYLSVMTIGVGFLSGKGGFWFGAGGFLCYFVLSPLLTRFADPGVASLVSEPSQTRAILYKPLGIGMLVGAAVGGIIAAFPLIVSAMKSMHSASQQQISDQSHGTGDVMRNDEMPISFLYTAIGVGALVMIWIAFSSVPDMTFGRAAVMAILGTLWVWVAGVVVSECMGRTNWSPLSGMTLIAVTIVILIAKGGLDDAATITSSMLVGAAICLAISQASDMMLDLKSGYLVGAIPRRQQLAQFVGAWLGPVIVIFLMILLNQQYEIGSERDFPHPRLRRSPRSPKESSTTTSRPTATRQAPGWDMLLALSGLGGIGVLIALGFYMPFQIALTYTVGNVLRIVSDKALGVKWSHEVGIPIAAGLIVGEALVGVGNALVKVFFAKPEFSETAMRLGRWAFNNSRSGDSITNANAWTCIVVGRFFGCLVCVSLSTRTGWATNGRRFHGSGTPCRWRWASSALGCCAHRIANWTPTIQRRTRNSRWSNRVLPRFGEVVDRLCRQSEYDPATVLHCIDEECVEPFSEFAEARQSLVKRFGLEVYADVMTEFASAERYVNRSWSAAADGYVEEIAASLARANHHLQKTAALLNEADSQFKASPV